MGRPQISFAKRQREQAKRERKRLKAEKRAQKKTEKEPGQTAISASGPMIEYEDLADDPMIEYPEEVEPVDPPDSEKTLEES